jgi:hypothetical protein
VKRRTSVAAIGTWLCGGCAHGSGPTPSYGIVVDYNLLPGASMKQGIAAVSDTGQTLFSPAQLRPRTATSRENGAGRNAYGGGSVPRWVRVTWREGDWYRPYGRAGWTGGVVVGDHRIEVASRIPREVLASAAVRGHALRLVFWLADDSVLLAWDVEAAVGGTTWRYSMHGGDFVEPTVFNGKLVEPGWYLTPDGHKVVIDR